VSRRWWAVVSALALLAATLVASAAPVAADQNEPADPALRDAQRLVAVGGLHTCALMDSGAVRCWGDNRNGQLGNGTRAVSNEPRVVESLTGVVALTAGNAHTCALLSTSTVRCWGLNSNGQIGKDPVLVNSSTTPVDVPGLRDVRAIAAGGFHNCALLGSGAVRCWGLDGVGQLGDGAGSPLGEAFTPVEVAGLSGVTALAAGEFHTCALLGTGGVSCWGHGGFGQLGDGTDMTPVPPDTEPVAPPDRTTPHPVLGLPDGEKKALAITAGYGHTCAVVSDDDDAEQKDTVRCWGNNSQGQIGDGTTTNRSAPVRAKVDADPVDTDGNYNYVDLTGADLVTAGQYHTCARRVDGRAWCWGNAGRGQTGDGTKGEYDRYTGVDEKRRFMWRSARRTTIEPVSALTAGGFHTCALLGTAMRCWGYNFYGQLGAYESESGSPVTVTSLQGAGSVTTGTDSACARVTVPAEPDTHQPVCWGTNERGELGADLAPTPTSNTTIPVKVAGLSDVAALEAGNGHTCTLPTGSGTPRCWGSNADGQLGDGTTTSTTRPVTVSGLTTATQLSAGGIPTLFSDSGHTCARLSDGTARCWGRNASGQLGNGTDTSSATPVVVQYDSDPLPPEPGDDHVDPLPLPDVAEVSAGGSHSCARKTNGTVWCWGSNGNGQLGIGDPDVTRSLLATQVKREITPDDSDDDIPLTGVESVAAGGRHSCASTASNLPGQVLCWGDNDRGQLGDGTYASTTLPSPILTIPMSTPNPDDRNPRAVALTGGSAHTCAVMDNASARCWGDDTHGQLGDGGVGGRSADPVTPVGIDNDTADTIRSALLGLMQPDDLVTSLSAGRRNTCASLIDNTVSCWGSNSSGQLGDGVGPTRTTPIAVRNLLEGVNGNRSPLAADDAASTAEDASVAVVVLGNDSDPDGDALSVLLAHDPAHGTASGSGSTISYTPDADFCGTDRVTYRVFDGRNGVADAIVTITVSCVDDAPVAVDDDVATEEETPVVVPVLTNDTDPDTGDADPATSDTRSVLSVTQPTHGQVALDAGVVTYTPAADHTGADSFTYVVQDGDGLTDRGSVAVTVTPRNDPPVAVDDAASTSEDSAVLVDVLANDSDPDAGDALTIGSLTQPTHGLAVVDAGKVRYTPADDFSGTDSFSYTADDGHGGTGTATVTVSVGAVNDGPDVRDDTASTQAGVVITVPVLANDSDPDGDPLTITAVTQPSHGTAQITTDGIRYTPGGSYSGSDAFTYTAKDSTGASGTASVRVSVAPANYAPFGGDDRATTAEDTAVVVQVLDNDYDPEGASLSVSAVTQPSHGHTAVEGSTVRYTPAADFWGTDSFTYVVSDGAGGTDTVAVAVTVTSVADAPQAVDDVATTAEDTAVTVSVLGNDSDADGDTVALQSVTQPTRGTTTIVQGAVRYAPEPGWSGSDSFGYTVSDGRGGTATGTVSVTVTPVNDAPTGPAIANRSLPWGQLLEVPAQAQDADGDTLAYSLVSPPAGAAVDSAGLVTWTPQASDVGTRTLTVRASDGTAVLDRSFTVTVRRQATALAYDGVTAGEYSDPAALSATLTRADGTPLGGASIGFAVAGRSVAATTDADGRASAASPSLPAPGSATVVASFPGTAAYEPSTASRAFTVLPEQAVVTTTGPGLVTTTGTAAAAQLTAVVTEAADGSFGSALGAAQVRFTDLAGAVLCTAGVSTSTPGRGTVACTTAALPLGSRALVATLLTTSYAADLDVAALAVATLPAGSAAGGGAVADGSGQRTDVAFRAVPVRKAFTGDALQVFRQAATLEGVAREYAFVVSSGTISSLTRACTTKAPKTCSTTLQATGGTTRAVNLTTGAVLDLAGDTAVRIDATDRVEPSGATAPYDLVATLVTGPRPFSVGSPADQRPLVSGNIRIPA
jgi:alpha-tubulin suppressor-like RCC1 family protein